MRVLIVGDSLPYARPKKGQRMEATWPILLKEALPGCEIWQRARPRHCSTDALVELEMFTDSLDFFDAVVVQVGIADCTPRPYPRWLYEIAKLSIPAPRLRKIERFAHRHMLWLYCRQWVSLEKFGQVAGEIVETAHRHNPHATVAFIAIAPPTKSLLALLPSIGEAAQRYDDVLRIEVQKLDQTHRCRWVNPYQKADPLQITVDDGHHLSCYGHQLVAAAVAGALTHPMAMKA